jgi:hypothetical protein
VFGSHATCRASVTRADRNPGPAGRGAAGDVRVEEYAQGGLRSTTAKARTPTVARTPSQRAFDALGGAAAASYPQPAMEWLIATFALIALIALGFWLIGSLVLRVVGVLIVIAGLVGAVQGQTAGLLVAAIGAVAWLAGHSLYAYRHDVYRSPLARRLFLSRPLQALDPTRGWAIPADAPDEARDGRAISPSSTGRH